MLASVFFWSCVWSTLNRVPLFSCHCSRRWRVLTARAGPARHTPGRWLMVRSPWQQLILERWSDPWIKVQTTEFLPDRGQVEENVELHLESFQTLSLLKTKHPMSFHQPTPSVPGWHRQIHLIGRCLEKTLVYFWSNSWQCNQTFEAQAKSWEDLRTTKRLQTRSLQLTSNFLDGIWANIC